MEYPIYKLDNVVYDRKEEALQSFEGPLDLILYLLGKNKIEIQNIQIALILDQYLAYIEERQKMDLEVASEFIAMAAHLMYIKTRMLLSIEDEEAQNELDMLIQSLEERKSKDVYTRIRSLTDRLSAMNEFGRNVMTKNPEPMERGKIYEYDHDKADLFFAMQEVKDRVDNRGKTPDTSAFREIVKHEPYPVKGKAEEIIAKLKHFGLSSLQLLFRGSKTKSEIVATFLAVLELCRNKIIHIAGSMTDCTVECDKNAPDTVDF